MSVLVVASQCEVVVDCMAKLADPKRPIQDITKDLVGTSISVKVTDFSLPSSFIPASDSVVQLPVDTFVVT